MTDRSWWAKIAEGEKDHEFTDEEDRLAVAAYAGLIAGNLAPLAAFLREGYALNYILRREIVHAITGEEDNFYRLELHSRGKKGETSHISKLRTRMRNRAIGEYVERKIPELNNQRESAFKAAETEFGVSRAVVVAAWSSWQRIRKALKKNRLTAMFSPKLF